MKFKFFIPTAFFLLFFAMLFAHTSAIAQSTSEDIEPPEKVERDSARKQKSINIPGIHKKGRLKTYWVGLKAGINGYTAEGKFNMPTKYDDFELRYGGSQEWSLLAVGQEVDLFKNQLFLTYETEFVFNIYRFSNDITLLPGQEEVTLYKEGIDLRRNKLRTTSFNVPVLLTYKSKKGPGGQRFEFGAGAYGSVMLGAKLKQKSKENGKVKVKDDFNLNKFNYGLAAKIGWGTIAFYGKYSLTDFFKKNEGPSLTPFTFGIVIVGE